MKEQAIKFLTLIFWDLRDEMPDQRVLFNAVIAPYLDVHQEFLGNVEDFLVEYDSLQKAATLKPAEELKLEFYDSLFDEHAFKCKLQKDALAQAIGIVFVKYLDRKAQSIISLYRNNDLLPDNIGAFRRSLYKMGDKVDDVYWAQGVFAFGNYIRHHQEWKFKTLDKTKNSDGETILKVKQLQLSDITGTPLHTIEPLHNLGIEIEEIVNGFKDQSTSIVEKLGLSDIELSLKRLRSWMKALKAFALKEISSME